MSDLLLLGRATIEETRALLHWMKAEAGFNKLGVCGLSMGKVLHEHESLLVGVKVVLTV